ncbi:hypothetical protein EOD39_7272 [Acipenser ruthenus]|uniref:DEP domain-containing protein n=1 Tax=Acipenser ruthenus TaxID=7906 RepID=A0A444U7D0_ACIRT|nr:hypothetical protein EOD39_7272 [Acipenser ruthenus]
MENQQILHPDGHVLGDSAYPLETYLLTPYRDNGHLTRKQSRYNCLHRVYVSKGRVTVLTTYENGTRALHLLLVSYRKRPVEALHVGTLMAAHGYFFPISDHVLTLKDDGTFYRFQRFTSASEQCKTKQDWSSQTMKLVDKKRDKIERKILDSQERAFWDVHRPVNSFVMSAA